MSNVTESARSKMVDNQLRTTGVTSYAILDAFLAVPREAFVPARFKGLAYIDSDLEISPASAEKPARYLMEPSPLAKLVQLAEIDVDDVVLDVGCGTGYASAVISLLSSSVVALESDEVLAATATDVLAENGYDNVAVVTGPLEDGYAPEAPFDVIFIEGTVEMVPDAFFEQLREGGRIVVVEGYGNASRAKIFLREGGVTSERAAFNTSVKPLPGFKRPEAFVF